MVIALIATAPRDHQGQHKPGEWKMKKWTHKVVKLQRGMNGQWFAHRAAMTGTETEARIYAEKFATEQTNAGVTGTRIVVRTKGGKSIAEMRVGK